MQVDRQALHALIGHEAGETHAALLQRLSGELDGYIGEEDVRPAVEAVSAMPYATQVGYFPPPVVTLFGRMADLHGPEVCGRVNQFLVLSCVSRLPEALRGHPLPTSVRALYPDAVRRTLAGIASTPPHTYLPSDEAFTKDLRVAAGNAFPAGASLVDMRSSLGTIFRLKRGLRRNLRMAWIAHGRLGGTYPLYRTHVSPRHLDAFSEEGRRETYLLIADALELNPQVLGVIGMSWFYDPALSVVSPHLSYLREIPMNHGAILRRDGSNATHTTRALSTSRTRRRLYDEGKYQPVAYTVIWPRRAVLRWARLERSASGRDTCLSTSSR